MSNPNSSEDERFESDFFKSIDDVANLGKATKGDVELITADAKKRIDAALPGRALRRGIVESWLVNEGIDPREASSSDLMNAFNAIYRKVLLDETDEDLVKLKVLKEFFPDFNSPEAKVALIYLRQFKLRKIKASKKTDKTAKKNEALDKIKELLKTLSPEDAPRDELEASPRKNELLKLRDNFSQVTQQNLNKNLMDLDKLKSASPSVDFSLSPTQQDIDWKDREIKDLEKDLSNLLSSKHPPKDKSGDALADLKKARENLKPLSITKRYKDSAEKLRDELLKYCDIYLDSFEKGLLNPRKKPKRATIAGKKTNLKEKLLSLDFSDSSHHDALKECFKELQPHFSKTLRDIESKLEVPPPNVDMAKKIIKAILKDRYPNMSARRLDQRASLLLAEGVETALSNKEFDEIAREAGPQKLSAMELANLKKNLINLQYKLVGSDEIHIPFKDFKPSDFEDPEKISRLFKGSRLTLENGFFVLAVLEEFENKNLRGKSSLQSTKIRRELKNLIAKKLDVEDRLHKSEVSALINDALEERLQEARDAQKDYRHQPDKSLKRWKKAKKKEIKKNYKILREKLRLGEIKGREFNREFDKLMKDLEEHELGNIFWFSPHRILRSWWNRPTSQKMRDLAKNKGIVMPVRITARGLWELIKFPFKAAFAVGIKWPAYFVGNFSLAIYNFITEESHRPFAKTRTVVWRDIKRVVPGAFVDVKTKLGDEWRRSERDEAQYKGRTRVDIGDIEEEVQYQNEIASENLPELAVSPFGNLNDFISYYKKEAEKIK